MLGLVMTEEQQIISTLNNSIAEEIRRSSPKISRGENYQGLPYLVLDYPRVFDKTDVLLIRSFFWWGNFFSTTLHLSGKYKTVYTPSIQKSYGLFKENDYYLCINEDPWQHHFEEDNYTAIGQLSQQEFDEVLLRSSFIKISRKINLEHWANTTELLTGNFRQLIQLLAM